MIKVDLFGINFDVQNNAAVLVLKSPEDTNGILLWIGIQEAKSIFAGLNKSQLPRPMSHDS